MAKSQIKMRPKIKMRVVDWWSDDTEANFYANPFVKILSQKYEIIYSKKPDFLLCAPFGEKHFEYDCVKIFYTGENVRIDWNLMDYGIAYDFMDFGERYLRVPLFVLYNHNLARRNLNAREKFCAYMVSNGGAVLRERFFDKLSAYKCVDSGGKWRNNIGGAVENKHKWLQSYKFNLCFENSSYAGYLTEKLFDAYSAGCVPIYWGDTSLRSGVANDINGADIIDWGGADLSRGGGRFIEGGGKIEAFITQMI
ncbi:glycosyltransferase family 10 domain-containing protein [Helicobacter sp. 23-1045]